MTRRNYDALHSNVGLQWRNAQIGRGTARWLRDTLRRVINKSTNSNGASESVRHTEGTAMDTIPTIEVSGPTALIGGTDCKPRRSSYTSLGASS
jgi:hypothetical protein